MRGQGREAQRRGLRAGGAGARAGDDRLMQRRRDARGLRGRAAHQIGGDGDHGAADRVGRNAAGPRRPPDRAGGRQRAGIQARIHPADHRIDLPRVPDRERDRRAVAVHRVPGLHVQHHLPPRPGDAGEVVQGGRHRHRRRGVAGAQAGRRDRGIGPGAVGGGGVGVGHAEGAVPGGVDLHRRAGAAQGEAGPVAQRPGGDRLAAQALNGIQHRRRLVGHRVAELHGPAEIAVQHPQHAGERRQRLHVGVPVLGGQRRDQRIAGERRMVGLRHPAGGHDQRQRVGRRHQQRGQHRVRIQGDRGEQGIELLDREHVRGGRDGGRCAGGDDRRHRGRLHQRSLLLRDRGQGGQGSAEQDGGPKAGAGHDGLIAMRAAGAIRPLPPAVCAQSGPRRNSLVCDRATGGGSACTRDLFARVRPEPRPCPVR